MIPPRHRRRQLRQVALWTIAWTVYLWWAAIGWPDTLDGSRAALVLSSVGSSVGLVAWYGFQRVIASRPRRPPRDR